MLISYKAKKKTLKWQNKIFHQIAAKDFFFVFAQYVGIGECFVFCCANFVCGNEQFKKERRMNVNKPFFKHFISQPIRVRSNEHYIIIYYHYYREKRSLPFN